MTRTARGIKKGEPLRFIHGHNIQAWEGPEHPQWKDGRSKSAEARREYNRDYGKGHYARNRERVLEKNKAWRLANAEKIRDRDLRSFGITATEYDAILARQGGVCAICGQPETRVVHGKLTRLAVDHDHETGAVRGLLCYFCNTGIGLFREDASILAAAIKYIEGKAIQAIDGGISVYDKDQVPHAAQ